MIPVASMSPRNDKGIGILKDFRGDELNQLFEVTFLGTNGSCAYNNGKRRKYGTNTICVAVKAGEETLVFDTGTGFCGLDGLPGYGQDTMHLFYSHFHADHIEGLLFSQLMFQAGQNINIYGHFNEALDLRRTLDNFLSPPLYPVGLNEFKANLRFHTFAVGDVISLPNDVTVQTHALSHPGGSVGYRVEYGGKVFCYCSDVELSNHQNDAELLKLTKNADLLAMDAFFDDGRVIEGWGHSSWRQCAEFARSADAKRLALFHYNYNLTDSEIEKMEDAAKKLFPETFAAADFMQISL